MKPHPFHDPAAYEALERDPERKREIMRRHALKVDANHGEIRDGLRERGYVVDDFSWVGGGFPDLGVYLERTTVLLEVKMPRKNLTDAQQKFHAAWKGPLYIVRSTVEAIACLQKHGGRK